MPSAIDTTIALLSLAEVKEYSKVTTSNEDAILGAIINGVSRWIAGYLKRNLVSTNYVEYYSGDNSLELMLRNFPVTAISSIYIDYLRVWSSSNLVDPTNYVIKKDAGVVRAFNLLYGWQLGDSNIKVSYTAGYTAGTDGGTGTMPYEIRLAAKMLVDRYYRIGYSNRKLEYTSESMGNMNITFRDNDMPKDIVLMLDGWQAPYPSPQFEYAD